MPSLYNTDSSYGPLSKFFHWVISVLVILMLFTYFVDDIPDKVLRGVVFNAHKLLGLTILMLLILRFLWMLCNVKPKLPTASSWERALEHLVHWSLYLALFLMPLAGWIGTSAGGYPPRLGSKTLGLPIEKSETLSDFAFSVHNTLAVIIIILVSLHVLAALFHYFVKKDGILQRMLP